MGKRLATIVITIDGRVILRAPTDISGDVAQPVLIFATRSDGAVSFDHAEHLAAASRHATLVEVHTPRICSGWEMARVARPQRSTPSSKL
jgi:hypothetical protein